MEQVQDKKESSWDACDEESPRPMAERDAEGKKLVHDPKFAEKRKRHYNEFERVKQWRLAHAQQEEEEDDDEEQEHKKQQVEASSETQASS